MSNELLAKAAAADTTVTTGMTGAANPTDGIHVGSEGKGGLLNPEQSARFLDYMFDATVIGKVARTVRMRADTTEIDRVGVGEKLMKLASEADNTNSGNAAVQFSKGFYTELFKSGKVDKATSAGRLEIFHGNSRDVEWATPVLFMRTHNGRLFETVRIPESRTSSSSKVDVPNNPPSSGSTSRGAPATTCLRLVRRDRRGHRCARGWTPGRTRQDAG